MSLIDKIKNLFTDNKKQKEIKQIPVDTKFQNNRFNNIRIYAPDYVMSKENRYYVQVLDNSNNPIENETISLYLDEKFYEKHTDKQGYVSFKISPKKTRKETRIYCPSDEEFCPYVTAKLIHPDNINPEESSKLELYAPDMSIYSKDEPYYSARLLDSEGNPLSGETITFNFNEETFEKTTDEKGFASIELSLNEGTYTIETIFKSNDNTKSISKTSKIDVKTRNIDRKVMIEVKHLAMEFKVSKDKIDTLKEYIIRTIKRNKKEAEKIRILDDISFNIYQGERVGILGFNGAGKSTLLRIIAGIYEPSEGEIKIHGKIAPLLELSAGFDKNYTGKNNIFLNGALLSMEEDFIREKYDEIVEFSELGEHINYPVKNYSKGMRAKLGFSIATLINPEILIIDEILAVGDIKFRKKSSEKIKSMMKDGVTVLLVSHSINQIKNICDRCIWIENGQVYMEGPAKKVCDAYVKSAKKK